MIFWGCLVFCRENRIPKRAKFKIYFNFEGCRGFRCGSLFGAVVVYTGGRWCRVQGLPVVFRGVFRPFVPLLLCLWWIGFKYAFISHFKGIFSGFWGADVYLYGLRSLRGLWGFCVREWLGGFVACGVFCLSFSSFLLLSCFPAWLLLLVLSCFLGFVGWLLVLVGLLAFFPFRTALGIKRRGANCVPSCGACLLLFCQI